MGRCLIHSSNSAELISVRESTHNHGASFPQVRRDPCEADMYSRGCHRMEAIFSSTPEYVIVQQHL